MLHSVGVALLESPIKFNQAFKTYLHCLLKKTVVYFTTVFGLCYIYIYIYALSRRFYPKRHTLHSSDSFYILSALAFPGNWTHDLGVANAMLYQLSYRKAAKISFGPLMETTRSCYKDILVFKELIINTWLLLFCSRVSTAVLGTAMAETG